MPSHIVKGGCNLEKKSIGLALFALFIFLCTIVGIFGLVVEVENDNDQPSRFQTILKLDLISDNRSMIGPHSPGSGGGRGPGSLTL